jgi:hypothetical protein
MEEVLRAQGNRTKKKLDLAVERSTTNKRTPLNGCFRASSGASLRASPPCLHANLDTFLKIANTHSVVTGNSPVYIPTQQHVAHSERARTKKKQKKPKNRLLLQLLYGFWEYNFSQLLYKSYTRRYVEPFRH